MKMHKPPRVNLGYRNSQLAWTEFKLRIAVFSDLSGDSATTQPPIDQREFQAIDAGNFDSILSSIKPRIAVTVPDTLSGKGTLDVNFTIERMEDFTPAGIARKVEPLRALLHRRTLLEKIVTALQQGIEPRTFVNYPAAETGKLQAAEHSEKAALHVEGTVITVVSLNESSDDLLTRLTVSIMKGTDDVLILAETMVRELDSALSAQIHPILHHEHFQRLEGRWRGLHYLVASTDGDERVTILVLNISICELYDEIVSNMSYLDNHLGEIEIGGRRFSPNKFTEPFSCLIGDYEFDHSKDNVKYLRTISTFADAVHAPFITSASASLLNLDSWADLHSIDDFDQIFFHPKYTSWNNLRDLDTSRHLVLAMPRCLARLPYGILTSPVSEFSFEENFNSRAAGPHVWMSSAYPLAAVICRAFLRYGWYARIHGRDYGAVEDLPIYLASANEKDCEILGPTEVALSGEMEYQLSEIGLLSLANTWRSNRCVFYSDSSLRKPAVYDDPDATKMARFYARLSYLLVTNQIIQHLLGLYLDSLLFTYDDDVKIQTELQAWINSYVIPDQAGPDDTEKSSHPLSGGSVSVERINGNRIITIALLPCFQMETPPYPLISRVIVQGYE